MTESFAQMLRTLMQERGLSGRALARQVPCDVALISRYVNSRQRPSARMAAIIDHVLGADGELAALVPVEAPWQSPAFLSPDDARRLELAAEAPSRVDAQVLGSLAAVLAAQRLLDDRIGSAPMVAAARAQHDVAVRIARAAPAPLRAGALDMAAQYGYFRGWLAENTGRLVEAEHLYDAALSQSAETGNVSLISELISMKGHIAWSRGDPREVIRLSAAARRDPAAFPGQHAISAMQEARAHAVLGDARAAEQAAEEGGASSAAALEREAARPPWLYYQSPAYFTIQVGRVWLHLGTRDARYSARAVRSIAAGVAGLDATARQSEWGASYLLHLARAHMQEGDAEQASAAAAEAVATARRVPSAGLLAGARQLGAVMTRKWPDRPEVAMLAESLL